MVLEEEEAGAGLSGIKTWDETREIKDGVLTVLRMIEVLRMVGWARNAFGRWRKKREKRKKEEKEDTSIDINTQLSCKPILSVEIDNQLSPKPELKGKKMMGGPSLIQTCIRDLKVLFFFFRQILYINSNMPA